METKMIKFNGQEFKIAAALQRLSACFSQSFMMVKEGSEILVAVIDAIGRDEAISQIMRANPHFTPDIISTFEKIGRLQWYEPLALDPRPAARILLTLPYDLQIKHMTEPVELVIAGGEILQQSVWNLSAEQLRQVIRRGKVCDAASQRAWIEDQKQKALTASAVPADFGYTINRKRRVAIIGGVEFDAKQLLQILSELQ